AAMAVELNRPPVTALLISLGYLFIGFSVGAGLARSSVLAEVGAAALLIALAVVDRTWETFTLALFGPPVAGVALAGVISRPAPDGRSSLVGAFLGMLLIWLAVCLAGLRESRYPDGASLDGLCVALALLAVGRGLVNTRLARRSARAAYSGILGAVIIALSI